MPQANGSPVTAYYIEVGVESGLGTSHVTRVDASETQHSIADLKPNTTYRYGGYTMWASRGEGIIPQTNLSYHTPCTQDTAM